MDASELMLFLHLFQMHDHFLEIGGGLAFENHPVSRRGMCQRQKPCVQHLPTEELPQCGCFRFVFGKGFLRNRIEGISQQGGANGGELHPNLVSAAGVEKAFDKRCSSFSKNGVHGVVEPCSFPLSFCNHSEAEAIA